MLSLKFLLVAFSSFLAIIACPSNSFEGLDPNTCYYFINEHKTWLFAELDCNQRGGHLTSIGSGFENVLVIDIAKSNGLGSFWIGSTNNIVPGSFNWSDGSNTTYSNGQASNQNNYCFQIDSGSGKWLATSCVNFGPYVCKVKSTSAGNQTQSTQCPKNWVYGEPTKKCYLFGDPNNATTFSNALSYCRNQNADLISIHDFIENTLLSAYQYWLLPSHAYWLGLSCNSGSCTWTDGTPYNYSDWYDPSLPGSDSICGIKMGYESQNDQWRDNWNTGSCSERWPVACQKAAQL